MGPGNRAVLYGSYSKIPLAKSINKQSLTSLKNSNSKIEFRETQAGALKEWNHFDSNINNQLVYQKKILNSKNYEMDSRAAGIQNFGYQAQFEGDLDNKRKNEGIIL